MRGHHLAECWDAIWQGCSFNESYNQHGLTRPVFRSSSINMELVNTGLALAPPFCELSIFLLAHKLEEVSGNRSVPADSDEMNAATSPACSAGIQIWHRLEREDLEQRSLL